MKGDTVIKDLNSRTDRKPDRPDPDWVRGRCPVCDEEVVSNVYYIGGKGYIIVWECWASLGENPTCDYRRTL
jgi:hypothetical protein